MLLLDVFIKMIYHTSKAVLFHSLRQNKMGSPVAFVLDPRRKVDKENFTLQFATQLRASHTLLLQHHISNSKFTHHGKWQSSVSPITMAMASLQPASRN
jgi:hypothetical protein